MTKTTKIITIAALAAMLTGCGGNNEYTPVKGAGAEAIFAEACAACHGDKGAGKFGLLLAVAGSDDSVDEIARHIGEGGPVMPAFPNISEPDRMALAGYLKSM